MTLKNIYEIVILYDDFRNDYFMLLQTLNEVLLNTSPLFKVSHI